MTQKVNYGWSECLIETLTFQDSLRLMGLMQLCCSYSYIDRLYLNKSKLQPPVMTYSFKNYIFHGPPKLHQYQNKNVGLWNEKFRPVWPSEDDLPQANHPLFLNNCTICWSNWNRSSSKSYWHWFTYVQIAMFPLKSIKISVDHICIKFCD